MNWTMWPQALVLFATALSMGRSLALYGQPKKPDTYDIVDVLIGPALSLTILWAGGFFDVMLR
jgi:hypothetical protein